MSLENVSSEVAMLYSTLDAVSHNDNLKDKVEEQIYILSGRKA